MPAEVDYPDATDVEPTTINDIDSIRAAGDYRRILDCCLVSMGQSGLADAEKEAANDLRTRNKTVYDIQSVAEAIALAEAATFALNGGAQEDMDGLTTGQEQAVSRIKRRAEYLAVALTPEAHEADTDTLDRGEGAVTDGGTVAHAGDGEPLDMTVDENDGILVPEEVIGFVDAEPCVADHIRTGKYDDIGRAYIDIYTHAVSETDIPAGWKIGYLTSSTHGSPVADRYCIEVRIVREQ